MRNYSRWIGEVTQGILNAWNETQERVKKEDRHSLAKDEMELIAQVELGFTLLSLVDYPYTEGLPALVGRYQFHRLSQFAAIFPDPDRVDRLVANAAQLIPLYRNVRNWEDAVRDYCSRIPQQLRFYTVQDGQIARTGSSLYPAREAVYRDVLGEPLPYRKWQVTQVTPGAYEVVIPSEHERVVYTVNVTPEMITQGPDRLNLHDEPVRPRDQITIGWEELIKTSKNMDDILASLGEKRWLAEQIKNIRYEALKDGSLTEADSIELNGIVHLVGMVSSGKSTLMRVLTVWAAQHGYRIVLVLETVVDVIDWTVFFRQFGVNAAPIIGESSREAHLKKIHQNKSQDIRQPTNPILHQGPEFDWLSTACALQEDLSPRPVPPLAPQDYPCNKLHPQESRGMDRMCPYWWSCSTTAAARELLDSQVWITSIHGLLYKPVPPQLMSEYTTHLELAYRLADIVLIDEADRVQATLDEAATPGDILTGDGGAFLSRLQRRISEELDRERLDQLKRPGLSTWKGLISQLDISTSQSLALLKQEEWLFKTIGDSPFSPWSLFNAFARSLSGEQKRTNRKEDYDELRELFFRFILAPLIGRGGRERLLVDIARSMMTDITHASNLMRQQERNARLVRLAKLPQVHRDLDDSDGLYLDFAIWTAITSDTIDKIIDRWEEMARYLNLSDTDPSAFRGTSRELLSVIPPAPMGNIVAFQHFYDKNNPSRGGLRFVRYQGVGRALLLAFNRLFQGDGIAGPHTVLLSATSWAGSAYGYHVSHPVTAILHAQAEDVRAIREGSQMHFMPLTDEKHYPIFISGAGSPAKKRTALDKMAKRLAHPSGMGQEKLGLLERILNDLPIDRQNILLVVGSYDDAQYLKDRLEFHRSEWREKQMVAAVISDTPRYSSSGELHEGIPRGVIHYLHYLPPKFIIAPIWAIERGHNILNDLGQAAFGAVMFLVRPHPRPDDLMPLMQRMNRWAVETARNETLLTSAFRKHAGPDEHPTIGNISKTFEQLGRRRWYQLNRRLMSYSALQGEDLHAFIWQHLVITIQVIGRIVRGGAPARVYFCDAAFAPLTAKGLLSAKDLEYEDFLEDIELNTETERTSLLVGFDRILSPYFTSASTDLAGKPIKDEDRAVVTALYGPFYDALKRIEGIDL